MEMLARCFDAGTGRRCRSPHIKAHCTVVQLVCWPQRVVAVQVNLVKHLRRATAGAAKQEWGFAIDTEANKAI